MSCYSHLVGEFFSIEDLLPRHCNHCCCHSNLPLLFETKRKTRQNVPKVMTQLRVLSPEDIYTTLTADATFMSNIGTYKFTSQIATVPAISIVTPGQDLPNLERITGIEAVIHDAGEVSRRDYLTSATDALITYKMFLLVWDGGTGTEMNNAAAQAIKLFTGAEAVETISVPNEINAFVQTVIRIPENAAIMTI